MGPNGNGQRLPLPHDHDQPLAARDRRVDEVSRQHGVMLRRQRHHDGGIFRPLRLVDRGRVGGDDRVQFPERIAQLASVETGDEGAFLAVDADDATEVAVEDLAVVVVLGLHDLVAGRKDEPNRSILSASSGSAPFAGRR